MMRFIYNQDEDLNKFQEIIKGKNLKVEIYNENKFSDRKKALMYKNTVSAIMLPLIIVYRDKKPNKVFYQTTKINALTDFENYLKNRKQLDLEPFKRLDNYCKSRGMGWVEMCNVLKEVYDSNGISDN